MDLIDLATDGNIKIDYFSNEADALEELVYDASYDWVILTSSQGGGYNSYNTIRVVRRKDHSRTVKSTKTKKATPT
jgi:hypothetical protein